MKLTFTSFWKENKFSLIFLMLMFMFRSACADWNHVPSGSMKPSILEGDQIFINKLAYDVHLPFTHISLLKLADPKTGDVAIFDSKVSDKRLVKRVIGTPGDTVAMVNNQLIINGIPVNYEASEANQDRVEQLSNISHKIRISDEKNHAFANFPTVTVPAGNYLMLGDNRDKSADSRIIGFVPREEIVGRANTVVLSLNYDNYYLPRLDRFLKAI